MKFFSYLMAIFMLGLIVVLAKDCQKCFVEAPDVEVLAQISPSISQEDGNEEVTFGFLPPLAVGQLMDKARIELAVRFLSEMDDLECHQLNIGDDYIDWIHSVYRTNSLFIFFKCVAMGGDSLETDTVYGGRDSGSLYELAHKEAGWVMAKIHIPAYNNYSNPGFCGERIAFWGEDKEAHFVSVFDLKARELLRQIYIGDFEIATDNEGYFPEPIWNEGCTEVVFPKHYDQPEDIIISL